LFQRCYASLWFIDNIGESAFTSKNEEVAMLYGKDRNEREIIAGLYRREDSALAEVYRRYGRMLKSLAERITGNEADAEECVNDALLDLWQAVPPDRPTHLAAYVSALVRRRAIDRVRYDAAQRRCGHAYARSIEELSECLTDPEGEDWGETLTIRDCVQRFVDSLDERDRRLFLLRYYSFETLETAARLCGMSSAAAGMRLMRLRKRLSHMLTENGIQV